MSILLSSEMRFLKELNAEHKGCAIGYLEWQSNNKKGFEAAWRWRDTGEWTGGHIIVDTVAEIVPLAIQCIDYGLVVRAMERVLGRSLTMNELPLLADIDAADAADAQRGRDEVVLETLKEFLPKDQIGEPRNRGMEAARIEKGEAAFLK